MSIYLSKSELSLLTTKGSSSDYKKVLINRVTSISGNFYNYNMILERNDQIQYYYVSWNTTILKSYKLNEVIPTPIYEQDKILNRVDPSKILLYFIPVIE